MPWLICNEFVPEIDTANAQQAQNMPTSDLKRLHPGVNRKSDFTLVWTVHCKKWSILFSLEFLIIIIERTDLAAPKQPAIVQTIPMRYR